MTRTGPTNKYLQELIIGLRKQSKTENAPIWRDVAEKLGTPRRKRVEVNLSDIERNSEGKEVVLVPGVVLSNGHLVKPLTVAAWKFSKEAVKKIHDSKGKSITIEELMKENPKGSNVKLMV
ncbi:MAG TPA: 50S ribosomal protein L18e [archaeon]|nr:50S ribosomal protein L18e [archaeon]